MVLMRKGDTAEYVPDAFIEDYRKNGYKVDGEDDTVNGSADPNGDGDPDAETEGEADDANSEDAEETGKFVCPHCGKEYEKQVNLDKHIAEKHAE